MAINYPIPSPRFTEECFATLIALIFIKEAVKKLIHIVDTHPLHEHPVVEPNQDLVFPYDKQYLHCECLPPDPTKVGDSERRERERGKFA